MSIHLIQLKQLFKSAYLRIVAVVRLKGWSIAKIFREQSGLKCTHDRGVVVDRFTGDRLPQSLTIKLHH